MNATRRAKGTRAAVRAEPGGADEAPPRSGCAEAPSPPGPQPVLDGGCACGALRYRLLRSPLFVHCCHCTRCQRETGGPFAHHALIEAAAFEHTGAEPAWAEVPADSGARHRVARCPHCHTVLWNQWGSGSPVTLYLRVGTLDEPACCPPQAHIYVRSAQPAWMPEKGGAPAYRLGYDARRLWPPESLARWEAARTAARKTATRASRKS